jgi:hypothetical protein
MSTPYGGCGREGAKCLLQPDDHEGARDGFQGAVSARAGRAFIA